MEIGRRRNGMEKTKYRYVDSEPQNLKYLNADAEEIQKPKLLPRRARRTNVDYIQSALNTGTKKSSWK